MWLTDAQSMPFLLSSGRSTSQLISQLFICVSLRLQPVLHSRTHLIQYECPPRAEIGVGLTSFGSIFMFLGVVMFFDGGLLALGNVS